MPETLLSISNLLLFGRPIEDIKIIVPKKKVVPDLKVALATDSNIDFKDITNIDGLALIEGQRVLVKNQYADHKGENGIYIYNGSSLVRGSDVKVGNVVHVHKGEKNGGKNFILSENGEYVVYNDGDNDRHSPFPSDRGGLPSQIEEQILADKDPLFARIYGFSFEGVFYDLSRPVLFLVHGPGSPVTEFRTRSGPPNRARAPAEPSLTGLGEADFQFSDDIMVWSYDKADYTIRMDVETGMFEDVLLNAVLGNGGDGLDARGMNARGMNARGMNARGMNARGMNARGGGGD